MPVALVRRHQRVFGGGIQDGPRETPVRVEREIVGDFDADILVGQLPGDGILEIRASPVDSRAARRPGAQGGFEGAVLVFEQQRLKSEGLQVSAGVGSVGAVLVERVRPVGWRGAAGPFVGGAGGAFVGGAGGAFVGGTGGAFDVGTSVGFVRGAVVASIGALLLAPVLRRVAFGSTLRKVHPLVAVRRGNDRFAQQRADELCGALHFAPSLGPRRLGARALGHVLLGRSGICRTALLQALLEFSQKRIAKSFLPRAPAM